MVQKTSVLLMACLGVSVMTNILLVRRLRRVKAPRPTRRSSLQEQAYKEKVEAYLQEGRESIAKDLRNKLRKVRG